MPIKLFVFALIILPTVLWAETLSPIKRQNPKITMTTTQAMQLAGTMVDNGDYDHALQILTQTPKMNNVALEIERWFLVAQIAQKRGDYESAIKIYR